MFQRYTKKASRGFTLCHYSFVPQGAGVTRGPLSWSNGLVLIGTQPRALAVVPSQIKIQEISRDGIVAVGGSYKEVYREEMGLFYASTRPQIWVYISFIHL